MTETPVCIVDVLCVYVGSWARCQKF